MPPCLTLSNIRYVSRVKWSNPEKGVAPSPTLWCSKLSKREPSGHPRLWSPTLLYLYIYIYIYIYIYSIYFYGLLESQNEENEELTQCQQIRREKEKKNHTKVDRPKGLVKIACIPFMFVLAKVFGMKSMFKFCNLLVVL